MEDTEERSWSPDENSHKIMKQKDEAVSSLSDKSTNVTKNKDHQHDFSLHQNEEDRPNGPVGSSPKNEDRTPIQCTEDEVQRDAQGAGTGSGSEAFPQSQIRTCNDDIDLPHSTSGRTPPSEEAPRFQKPVLVISTNGEKFVDKNTLKLKYTGEESPDRKLADQNQMENVASSPLDMKPYLKFYPVPRDVSVYMLHDVTAPPSDPHTGAQTSESSLIQYGSEFSRLATYTSYPSDLKVFAITLAGDGFVFLSSEQSVECCFCKLRVSISELSRADVDPMKMHCSRSPQCPLKQGKSCGNRPVPKIGESGTVSNGSSLGTSNDNRRLKGESVSDATSGSFSGCEESPADSWYRADEVTLLPAPIVHPPPAFDTATDGVLSIEQAPTPLTSSRRNTESSDRQPIQTDSVVQQPQLQQPSLSQSASSARSTNAGPSVQHSGSTGSTAPSVQRDEPSSGDSGNGNRSNRSPSSAQNRTSPTGSEQSGASSSAAAASPPKNAKSSKKTKAAKKAEAANRKSSANSGASVSSSLASAPTASNKSNGNQSSEKGEQSKKKLTYADLGIFADKPKRHEMASLQKRLETYEGKWKSTFAKMPQELAECGMYYAGYADCARCFFCGGGLKNWENSDEPWVEHARWFPKCAYLLLCKSPLFTEIVQRKSRSNEKILMKDVEEEVKQKTRIAPRPLTTSLPAASSTRASASRSGGSRGSYSLDSNGKKKDTELAKLEAENEELNSEVTCKICMDEKSSVVFLPCGHMVACTDCAVVLKNCPLCRSDIRGAVKAHMDC